MIIHYFHRHRIAFDKFQNSELTNEVDKVVGELERSGLASLMREKLAKFLGGEVTHTKK